MSRVVHRGRTAAESRMLDTFSIQESEGMSYVDGAEVETWTELFQTPARVGVSGVSSRDVEVAGRTAAETTRILHIPVDADAIPEGRISAVPVTLHATADPSLAGARLILGAPAPFDQGTARRIPVTEVIR